MRPHHEITDIRELQPGQPLRGAGRSATAVYSVRGGWSGIAMGYLLVCIHTIFLHPHRNMVSVSLSRSWNPYPKLRYPIDSKIAKVWKSVPPNSKAQKLFRTSIDRLLLLYLLSPDSWVPTNPSPKSQRLGFKLLTGVPTVKEPNGKKKPGAGLAAPKCVELWE